MKIPDHLIQKWLNYKCRYIITLYHATTKSAARSIIQNGFDISRSKRNAFGRGANFATNPKYLTHYKKSTIITCLVRYNKKIPNPPFKFTSHIEQQKYIAKHGHTKPTYMSPPPNSDLLYYNNIYVVPNSVQILPIQITHLKLL